MATYRDLQDRIALDYFNRFDITNEIKRAINNTIKSVEAERFWFNETATALVATTMVAVPANFLTLDRLEVTISNQDYQLMQRSFDEIRDMNVSRIAGQPTNFAYHANSFALALYPDSAYPLICYYLKSLATLSADADSNQWTNECANYIAHGTALELMTSVIDANQDMISKHTMAYQVARNELLMRNQGRLTFRIRSTSF